MTSDLGMQSSESWKELVEQVKTGANPEEALRLREPLEDLSTLLSILHKSGISIFLTGAEEFWQRLVAKGVGGDTPLSFRLPDLGKLLEGAATHPQEEISVLPPCLCLDTVLEPE